LIATIFAAFLGCLSLLVFHHQSTSDVQQEQQPSLDNSYTTEDSMMSGYGAQDHFSNSEDMMGETSAHGGHGKHHGKHQGMMGGGNSGGGGMMGGGNSGGGGMMGGDGKMGSMMRTIHNLLNNHESITRTVEKEQDATSENSPVIVTRTTSDNAEVSGWIHLHVSQMMERIENEQPIRMWDPLFVQLFAHADEILETPEYLENGVQMRLEGTTPCGQSLAELHAKAVSSFVKFGMEAAQEPHDGSDLCS
jgi:hypothetical protein